MGTRALGFWKALDEVWPGTRHHRCWVHKTARLLDNTPKSVQPAMKADLRKIHGAPTRASAAAALAVFVEKHGAKYARAADCLSNDRDALLAFFDFPAKHRNYIRTTNPIENVFATIRHRTVRTKGASSPNTAKLMVFKLVVAAAKTWRRLRAPDKTSFSVRLAH